MKNDTHSPVDTESARPPWAQLDQPALPPEASGPIQRFTAAARSRQTPPAPAQAAPADPPADPARPVATESAPPIEPVQPAFTPAPGPDHTDGRADPEWVASIDPGPDDDLDTEGPAVDDLGPDDLGEDDEPPEGLDMQVLVEWVDTHIASIVARKVPTTGGYPRWCRQWWYHAEAIVRFESLRHAWMDLIGRPGTAKLSYFRDFLDPTLMTLMADDGPFGRCTPTKHIDHEPLGQDDPPPELFD